MTLTLTLKQMFEEDFQNVGQSWTYTACYKVIAVNQMILERIRVVIIRNAYDSQSSAVVEIFDPNSRKWNFLLNLPFGENLNVYKVSYVTDRTKLDVEAFHKDAQLLLERVKRFFE